MESKNLQNPVKSKATPFWNILGYAFGGCAYQLPFNAMWAFAMIFYTQVVGMDSVLAGIALAVTMFWDAIIDPLMGHISDNTRSRYGKRHPYMLFGGIAIAISFYFLWTIPSFCAGKWNAVAYLLTVNLIFRSALAVFLIPYGALGFEICTDYDERSKLQSVSSVVGMMTNLFAIALGWRLFFPNRGDVDGTKFASNYAKMGLTFSIISLTLVFFCLWATRKYIRDSRNDKQIIGNSLRAFYIDIRDIFLDRRAVIVFLFFGIAQIGSVLMASWQSFTWIYYMKFGEWEKTVCHSIGMIGFVVGAFLSSVISKKLDKKPMIFIGLGLAISGSLGLLLVFYTGFLGRAVTVSLFGVINIPVSLIVFAVLSAIYWMGYGIIGPVATSMVADLSEINKYETDILKDGGYSSVFTFVIKMVCSIGLLLQGVGLKAIGFKEGSETQSPETIDRLALLTFTVGIIFAVVAIIAAVKYSVNRSLMVKIKEELALREASLK
jgi:GPH family glycoside/pentoside/hexuronide:cation symporter